MPASNTTSSFGSVTRTIHWLMALLVISMIPLGVVANGLAHQIEGGATDPAILNRAQLLFSLHKTLGVFIFFLALARILWAIRQPRPAPLHPDRRAETFLAALVHWMLYASLLLVPLSGWVHHAATTGFAPIWWPFGQGLPFVPTSPSVAETAASTHILFERMLAISIMLHVAGALKHHFIDRDATLTRMLTGTTAAGPSPHKTNLAAPLTALGIYILSIPAGIFLGFYDHNSREFAALAAAQSDWQITDGTLSITVTQLGSPVQGQFAEWTSQIAFDPEVESGEAGTVTTTIAIGSLTLGTVTEQAMGPGFFDETTFPTATYSAQIVRDDTGYRADGELTLKGTSLPLSFPFELTVTDGTARMSGTTTVNRRDFVIGEGTDDASLSPEVVINMALTATQAP